MYLKLEQVNKNIENLSKLILFSSVKIIFIILRCDNIRQSQRRKRRIRNQKIEIWEKDVRKGFHRRKRSILQ